MKLINSTQFLDMKYRFSLVSDALPVRVRCAGSSGRRSAVRLNNNTTLLRAWYKVKKSEAAPARMAICSSVLAALPVRGGGARLLCWSLVVVWQVCVCVSVCARRATGDRQPPFAHHFVEMWLVLSSRTSGQMFPGQSETALLVTCFSGGGAYSKTTQHRATSAQLCGRRPRMCWNSAGCVSQSLQDFAAFFVKFGAKNARFRRSISKNAIKVVGYFCDYIVVEREVFLL